MTLYSPAIRASWLLYTAPLEGRVAWPYLDTRTPPLVTVGLGCALPSLGAFQLCPWLRAAATPASSAEVAAAWATLRQMAAAGQGGLHYRRYAYPGHLHLDDEAIDAAARHRLDQMAETLAAHWPAWSSWPAHVQAALLSLAWGVGEGSVEWGLTGPRWPHLHASLARRDWRSCAVEGQLNWRPTAANPKGNPGVRPRDWTVSALFLRAAGAGWQEACAGWVAGDSAEAAHRALSPLVAALEAEAAEQETTVPTES